MPVPADPKIYHIVHVDRLPSIIADGGLLCDAAIAERAPVGTTIGMNDIKQRRLSELRLSSHPDLYVGACVPFYFCSRSVMLYVISQASSASRGNSSPVSASSHGGSATRPKPSSKPPRTDRPSKSVEPGTTEGGVVP